MPRPIRCSRARPARSSAARPNSVTRRRYFNRQHLFRCFKFRSHPTGQYYHRLPGTVRTRFVHSTNHYLQCRDWKTRVAISLTARLAISVNSIFTYPIFRPGLPATACAGRNYRGIQLYNVIAPKLAVTGATTLSTSNSRFYFPGLPKDLPAL